MSRSLVLENFLEVKKNIYLLKKWNWDYLDAEKFQLECLEHLLLNPKHILLIFCSHPKCFTTGKGLQKIKAQTGVDLVEFDQATQLNFPIYPIKRGGGLTFHYEGQLVFYPLFNLIANKKAVHDSMIYFLELVKNILIENFLPKNHDIELEVNKEILGLWIKINQQKFKLASIGLAVTRYNTYHGMAFNFFHDEKMYEELLKVFPCGLPGNIYQSLENLMAQNFTEKLSLESRENFSEIFLKNLVEYFS